MLWQPINLTEACPANTQLTACSQFGFVYLSLLVQLYGDSWDRRKQEELHRDGTEESSVEEDDKYDFIVVGAGAAGCVVANRLSENENWKVLLLEAGGEQPDVTMVPGLSDSLLGSSVDWAYQTEPNGKSCLARKGQRCSWPRGKMMGGSSSINSFVYVRGNKLDYDTWAKLGNEGWSYEEVLPYFKKSEKNVDIATLQLSLTYHGVNGEQSISLFPYSDKPSKMMTEAFHETGLPIEDVNGRNQLAVMHAQAMSQNGERVSTNNAFIQPIRYKRKNLTVKVNSEVIKILINNDKIAEGVKYIHNGTVHTAYSQKEVIVSGGTINSPKLLMLSGIGPKRHLSKLNISVVYNLAVGENLHDHVTFNGILIGLSNTTATNVAEEQILQDVKDFKNMKEKHGPLSAHGPNNLVAFIKTNPCLSAPDIQYAVGSSILDEYLREPEIYDQFIISGIYYDSLYLRAMNLVPKSRGKLLLNPDDPHGKPLIDPNYLGDSRDFTPLLKAVRYALELENTTAFKSNGAYFVKISLKPCDKYVWGTDDYFLCMAKSYTSSTYHPVGTCKMGPKRDRKAVVDPRLRVYGISRLRVIDASIMPIVNRGNTNAPSIMIGEKGAAMIIEDWREKLPINNEAGRVNVN